jgi:hypothetical protein
MAKAADVDAVPGTHCTESTSIRSTDRRPSTLGRPEADPSIRCQASVVRQDRSGQVSPCHDPKRGLRRPFKLTRENVEAGLVEVPPGTQAHDLSLDIHAPAHQQAHALRRAGGGSIIRLFSHSAYRREKRATVQRSSSSSRSWRRCRACFGAARKCARSGQLRLGNSRTTSSVRT